MAFPPCQTKSASPLRDVTQEFEQRVSLLCLASSTLHDPAVSEVCGIVFQESSFSGDDVLLLLFALLYM